MSMKKILQEAADNCASGSAGVLGIITFASGSTAASVERMIFITPDSIEGSVGGGVTEKKAIDAGRAMIKSGQKTDTLDIDLSGVANADGICGGKVSLLLISVSGKRRVALIGAGHVNQALAGLLEKLGYGVTLYDKRPRLPWDNYTNIKEYDSAFSNCGDSSYIVIACHDHDEDKEALKILLKSGIKTEYLAVVSSKKKFVQISKEIRDEGIEFPENIYAPAGLDLNGNEPFEVALSIAAQIEKIFYQKGGMDLKDVKK